MHNLFQELEHLGPIDLSIYLFYYNSINLNIYLSAHLSIYLLLEADNLVPEPVDLLLLLPLAHRQLPVLHGSVLKGGVHQFSSRVVMENRLDERNA